MNATVASQQFADVHCIFLCGGSGTRLWPLSRKNFPKQFLSLGKPGVSLLQESIARIDAIVPVKNRWLVTAHDQSALATAQTQERVTHILAEPAARNTAPAIAWAAWELLQINPKATMVVLSSDHVIQNIQGFETTLTKAVQLAKVHKRFVTVGILPTAPATGFGYIERGAEIEQLGFNVTSFREKPDRPTAEQFLLSGRYLWNAGMFVWQVKDFWDELKILQPALTAFFEKSSPAEIKAGYALLPSEPIDIAFMEKTQRAACVPSLFDWDDIGSWAAVQECFADKKSNDKNYLSGDVYALETKNSVVSAADGIFVTTLGLSDMCVVATKDAVLVMPLTQAQNIKQVITHLEKNKRQDLL